MYQIIVLEDAEVVEGALSVMCVMYEFDAEEALEIWVWYESQTNVREVHVLEIMQ